MREAEQMKLKILSIVFKLSDLPKCIFNIKFNLKWNTHIYCEQLLIPECLLENETLAHSHCIHILLKSFLFPLTKVTDK